MEENGKRVIFETNGKTYLEQYRELIDYRRRNPIPDGVPFEVHHIRPRSIFPELVNDPNNLIRLTPKEHVRAHFLLWQHYKLETDDSDSEIRMCYAFWRMVHTIEWKGDAELGWISDKYEELRVDFVKRISGDKNPMKNPEVRTKQSEAMKNPEVRAKMSEAIKGDKNPMRLYPDKNPMRKPEVRAKKFRKVLQYSLDGTFVAEYPSIKEAAVKTNSSESNISNCCMGRQKTHNGFVWKYAECNGGKSPNPASVEPLQAENHLDLCPEPRDSFENPVEKAS